MTIFNSGRSVNISSSNGVCKIIIDGKGIIVKGNNVSVVNGKIVVDGKEFHGEDIFKEDYCIQNVTIEGNVKSVDCGGSVIVNGNVEGSIDCGGSVNINGDHKGSIDCGGSVIVKNLVR